MYLWRHNCSLMPFYEHTIVQFMDHRFYRPIRSYYVQTWIRMTNGIWSGGWNKKTQDFHIWIWIWIWIPQWSYVCNDYFYFEKLEFPQEKTLKKKTNESTMHTNVSDCFCFVISFVWKLNKYFSSVYFLFSCFCFSPLDIV